jgi:peptidoglycan/LPS O-acetylase OafA/YrhL
VTHRRADIQGLRALAVLVVVAFHAGLPVRGGFTGVDSFFVISGFVITSMLRREWEATGRIAFVSFYVRRFKRLAPALSLVVAFTVLGAALVLSPLGPQENVAKTGFGALFFVANWVISSTTGGYFDQPAGANPLLHTWSLSVEEQFYFLFPALLFLGLRLRRAWLPVAVVTAVSLAGALALGGFYDTPTRAWEFGVGALLTFARLRSPRVALAGAAVGAELLLLSLGLIGNGTPYPSVWTLLPVAATALLLLAGSVANPLSRLLSTRPLVAVGDWSYSIYLWHWPLIVFAAALWPATPHVRLYAALVSFVPALLSFRFVEQPLRTLQLGPVRRVAVLATAVVAFPLVIGSAAASSLTGVWHPGYQPTDMKVAHRGVIGQDEYYDYIAARFRPCASPVLRGYAETLLGHPRCAQSRRGAATVALIGDSHAEHLFVGLAEALPQQNVLYDAVNSPPHLTDRDFARVVQYVAAHPSIRVVVLNAAWAWRHFTDSRAIGRTLQALSRPGRQIFVADDGPWFTFDASACKYRQALLLPAECSIDARAFWPQHAAYTAALASAMHGIQGAHLLHIAQSLCTNVRCTMVENGELLFRDSNHFNVDGSRFAAAQMLRDARFVAAFARRGGGRGEQRRCDQSDCGSTSTTALRPARRIAGAAAASSDASRVASARG